jgi:hypothetical protein
LTGQTGRVKNGTGHLEKDSSDWTSETGQTGQVGLTGHPVQEREERTARRLKNICKTYRFAKMFRKTKILWNI